MSGNGQSAYVSSATATRLRQGEVLSNVIERPVKWSGRTEDGDDFAFEEIVHPYVVLLTQDCDLQQDANCRAAQGLDEAKRRNALVANVLLVVASEFEQAQAKGAFAGRDVKKRALQNKDERFQFLSAVPAKDDALGQGVPSLLLDFKRFFTYPTEELLRSIERKEAFRRAILATPYTEHLSSRFGYFIQRVGLPSDHHDLVAGADQLPGAVAIPLLGNPDGNS